MATSNTPLLAITRLPKSGRGGEGGVEVNLLSVLVS